MERKNLFLYILILFSLSIFHIIIGSSLFLLMVFLIVSLIGVFVLKVGELKFSNLFVFLLSLYYGFFNLLIKALLNQKLETNLIYPFESGVLVLLGFFTISIVSVLTQYILENKSSKFSNIFEDQNFITNSVIPLLIVGIFFRMLHVFYNSEAYAGDEAFGGFGSFRFILILGLVFLFKKYSETYSFYYRNIIFIVSFIIVALAILTNTKKDIFDFVFLSIMCVLFFKIKVNLKFLTLIGTLTLLVVLFVSPVIHLVRDGSKTQKISERIESVIDILVENEFNPSKLYAAEAVFMEGFTYSYGEYRSYIYPSAFNLDRFLLIFTVDQVNRGTVIGNNYVGFNTITKEVAEAILPSILIDKDPQIATDIMAWKYGIRESGSVARPVLGYIATSIGVGGVTALMIFPFIELFIFFLLMNYMFGRINGRVFGVFGFVLLYGYVEKGTGEFFSFLIRDYILIFCSIYFLYKLFSLKLKIG